VNAVADAIHQEFPDVLVETLAYRDSRKPPKVTRPRPNVIVRLCSFECSFAQPLSDPQNQGFHDDLVDWAKISPRLFVWDYVVNFNNYMLPHPNQGVLGENLRTFSDNGVVAVLEQADRHSPQGGEFAELKGWVLAKLLWDPTLDDRVLTDEFLAGYYGPAGAFLGEYLEMTTQAVQAGKVRLPIGASSVKEWLGLDEIEAAATLFDRAEAAVAHDPVLLARVRKARLPLDQAWIYHYNSYRKAAEAAKRPFRGPADINAALTRFVAQCRALGMTQIGEHLSLDDYEARMRSLLVGGESFPLPAEFAGLGDDAYVDKQEAQIILYQKGFLSDIVADRKASNGKAVRMPGQYKDWAVQLRKESLVDMEGTFRCYVVVRCEVTDPAHGGTAFTAGLHGATAIRKSVADVRDEEYHTYDLGVRTFNGQELFYVAPAENGAAIEGVYVDRFFFVRQAEDGAPAAQNLGGNP
jgi:hypothetical protein